MSKIFINTDGGSRGNPGPAAIGIVFYDQKESMMYSYNKRIGIATNNEAEYKAIIKALEILTQSQWLKKNQDNQSEVVCRLDSQLVVEQVNGRYKIKKDHIFKLHQEIQTLIKGINIKISFMHVTRDKNREADKLVNLALDYKDRNTNNCG